MSRLLVRLLINAVALWLAFTLVPGIRYTGSPSALLFIAVIFGLVNALVRPLLLLLTCPFIVLTLGLFVLIINGLMLRLTAWLAGPTMLNLGLVVEGFWPTFWGAVVISIVSGVANLLIRDGRESEEHR
jgi:putative membrane protein